MKHAFRNKSFDIGTTKNEWLSCCARGAASCAHMLYGATRVFPQSTLSDLWTDRHTVVGGIEKGVGKEIAKWKHVVSVSWAPPLRPLSFAFPLGVSVLVKCFLMCSGDSANAVPPTKKSRTRVTNMCGDRRCQPNRSAMERPHSGPTAVVIAVQPVPGKYDWNNGSDERFPLYYGQDGRYLRSPQNVYYAMNLMFWQIDTMPFPHSGPTASAEKGGRWCNSKHFKQRESNSDNSRKVTAEKGYFKECCLFTAERCGALECQFYNTSSILLYVETVKTDFFPFNGACLLR